MSRHDSLTPEEDLLDLALAVKDAQAGLALSEKYKERLTADLDNVSRALTKIKLDLVAADQQLAEAAVKVTVAKDAFEAYVTKATQ